MSVNVIDQNTFEATVLQSDKPVLVDFWASWCGPCRMLAPVVEQLSEDHPEVVFGKVNIDEQPELAARYQVASIPTLILFKNGKPAATSVGVRPKAALEKLLS